MSTTPRVLDVCCGSRMFWFDKADTRATFVDIRREDCSATDNSHGPGGRRSIVISPDVLADFAALPFRDGLFDLVAFDPPHLTKAGQNSWLAKKYGKLPAEWGQMLTAGFSECFRVLRRGGTLVFKWNETDIPVARILELAPQPPLFGNRCGKSAKTHWIVFQKY